MAPSSLPHPLSHADTLTLPTPFAGNTAITASYATSFPRGHLDATKPTILFFHSFTTDTTLFAPQFDDADLTAQANLIAVDLIGHGRTRIGKAGVSRLAEDGLAGGEVGWNDEGVLCRDHWTYWDSAWMALGVLRELGVEKAFVAGTSQGGWVAVRCALLAPEVVSLLSFSLSVYFWWMVWGGGVVMGRGGRDLKTRQLTVARSENGERALQHGC